MQGIIAWFIRNSVAANLLMIVMIVAGIAAALSTTIRTFPEIATNAVTVEVAYPGATPTEVSDAILIPIEGRLQGLEGVRKLTGTASPSLGTVTAELTSGASVQTVKDDIETEVSRITTFPSQAETPRVSERDTPETAVQFVLYGDVSRTALKSLAEVARDDLTRLPEISQVEISGIPTDLIEVTVDRATLRSYGLGLTELGQIIASESVSLSGGSIDTGTADIQVRTIGEAETADALRSKVLFSSPSGGRVTLEDIAAITDTLAEDNISATVAGQPGVFITVRRSGAEQVLTVADAAKSYVDNQLRPTLPPASPQSCGGTRRPACRAGSTFWRRTAPSGPR